MLTKAQQVLMDSLREGTKEQKRRRRTLWLDCAADTWRIAATLRDKGLLVLSPRNALGDFQAQLA